jgi:hypothetical protein
MFLKQKAKHWKNWRKSLRNRNTKQEIRNEKIYRYGFFLPLFWRGSGGGFTIAIDLGGTLIKIGLLKDGELIDRKEIPAQSAFGLNSQLPELELVINQILFLNLVQKDTVLGIGLSFAGLVDSIANRILSTNQKYDDGPETDLVGWALEWLCWANGNMGQGRGVPIW